MTPNPPQKLSPVRKGHPASLIRGKEARGKEQNQTEAEFRRKVYQDIIALLDIADRLTQDLSRHEDRYGLEWLGLARQINEHYKVDLLKIIPEFHALVMSKEGTHCLPKGLYRQLLDYVDECGEFLKWARTPVGEDLTEGHPESQSTQSCKRFRKACVEMRQQICIFENERAPGETSFFK
jgi:hypothetical protein